MIVIELQRGFVEAGNLTVSIGIGDGDGVVKRVQNSVAINNRFYIKNRAADCVWSRSGSTEFGNNRSFSNCLHLNDH